jgi:hypothetical protein
MAMTRAPRCLCRADFQRDLYPVSPRPRKFLDPRSRRFEVRFAIRLRALLDERKMGPSEFVERLQAAGLDVTIEAVKKWLSGDRLPHADDAEKIGKVLGLKDYRQVWPLPI